MDIEKLIERYPRLYHMAERETWDSISEIGLMSTSAVLDLFEINGVNRHQYESSHRSSKMDVAKDGRIITLRDQKPMPVGRLNKALQGHLSPEQWYQIINDKVFFWATRARLDGLLNAKHYRTLEHDVLIIDTDSFVRAYRQSIMLCHMNSGNTFPYPHHRDAGIFRGIDEYPVLKNGNPAKEVAELVVKYSVPDIAKYVVEVNRMRGGELICKIF